jgi:hypothetical protein
MPTPRRHFVKRITGSFSCITALFVAPDSWYYTSVHLNIYIYIYIYVYIYSTYIGEYGCSSNNKLEFYRNRSRKRNLWWRLVFKMKSQEGFRLNTYDTHLPLLHVRCNMYICFRTNPTNFVQENILLFF